MALVFCVFLLVPFISSVTPALDKVINEPCSKTEDCAMAYSFCSPSDKVCKCIEGFSVNGTGFCIPPGLACPTWSGAQQQTRFQPCQWKRNFETGEETDSCETSKEFCFTYPKTQKADGSYTFVGHCCPRPPADAPMKMKCPLTVSNDKGTCPDLSNVPADMGLPADKIRTCSYSTHDCVERLGQQICCPLPCTGTSSHFAVNGKCYDTALPGDSCTHTAQCGGGSVCQSSGRGRTCQCKGRLVQDPSPHCE